MKIYEMPKYERPYEKAEKYGVESLSDSELLAILLRSGSKNFSSVILAQKILKENSYSNNGLRFLSFIGIKELTKFEGIGRVKAITLKAVGEIVKRMEKPLEDNIKISSSKEAANIMIPKLRYEKKEKICVILIDTKGTLIKIHEIKSGDTKSIDVNIKDIFHEAIRQDCTRIILVHNHPSGDPTPSEQDIIFTKHVSKVGKKLGIDLLDHIVIGDGVYNCVIF